MAQLQHSTTNEAAQHMRVQPSESGLAERPGPCPSEVAGVASAWPITASATSAFEKHYQRLYQRVATRGSSQLDFEPTSLVLMP